MYVHCDFKNSEQNSHVPHVGLPLCSCYKTSTYAKIQKVPIIGALTLYMIANGSHSFHRIDLGKCWYFSKMHKCWSEKGHAQIFALCSKFLQNGFLDWVEVWIVWNKTDKHKITKVQSYHIDNNFMDSECLPKNPQLIPDTFSNNFMSMHV